MQNRFLVAMILSLVILSVWGAFNEKKIEAERSQAEAEAAKEEALTNPEGIKDPATAGVNVANTTGTAKAETEVEKKLNSVDEATPISGDIFLQSEKLRFEFDQRGAALRSVYLLDQFETVEDKKNVANLKEGSKEGRLEFVRVYDGGERAFELFDRGLPKETAGWANTPLWKTVGQSADGKSVSFELSVVRNGQSFVLRKIFKLNDASRRLDVSVELVSGDDTGITKGFWMNTTGGVFPADRSYLLPNDPSSYGHSTVASKDAGEIELLQIKVSDVLDAKDQFKVVSSDILACDMGVYFGAYLWPKNHEPIKDVRLRAIDTIEDLNIEKASLEDLRKYGPLRIWSQMGMFLSSSKKDEVAKADFDYYVGPKDHRVIEEAFGNDADMLETYLMVADSELTAQSIACCTSGPLGWLIQSVSKAVIWTLNFFTKLIGSMGAAIILLTICVKTIMFPITRKSQTAMHIHGKKMAKLKPQIEALKLKYKKDPQKFQKAHMALLKETNTKLLPLGGCLPMLLNIPVFFGLFSAIRFDYELRHASFLWCTDLSMPDRIIPCDPFALPCFCGPGLVVAGLNILPLLMIAAMFFQQLGMPKSPDPQMQQQQKMMMFMPLMFGVFMYAYAAGLSVYWLSSSLFGIFEQRVIKKLFPIDKGDLDVTGKVEVIGKKG
ncbi:MAG: YidC/Oxa1 family membrane protein insertase [Planctomycetota bacterium]|jgi:YidC/Oxa1 family membrane protein insertase